MLRFQISARAEVRYCKVSVCAEAKADSGRFVAQMATF